LYADVTGLRRLLRGLSHRTAIDPTSTDHGASYRVMLDLNSITVLVIKW